MSCNFSEIFGVKTQIIANRSSFGFGCLNFLLSEDPRRFFSFNQKGMSNLDCEYGGDIAEYDITCNSTESITYKINVNDYGDLENKEVLYSLNTSHSFFAREETNGQACIDGCCPEGGRATANFLLIRENGKVTTNNASCSNQVGTPAGCEAQNDSCNNSEIGNCVSNGCNGINDCELSYPQNCTEFQYQAQIPENCNDFLPTSISLNQALNNEITITEVADKVKQGLSKKMSIREDNKDQNSIGTRCPENDLEDYPCYGFIETDSISSSFNPISYDIIGQKWRIRLGVNKDIIKEDLSQKYMLYVYYFTDENSDTTISPCCNSCNCFDGTIYKQKEITITYNDKRKLEEYVLSDYFEFDNFDYSGPSRDLYFCSERLK